MPETAPLPSGTLTRTFPGDVLRECLRGNRIFNFFICCALTPWEHNIAKQVSCDSNHRENIDLGIPGTCAILRLQPDESKPPPLQRSWKKFRNMPVFARGSLALGTGVGCSASSVQDGLLHGGYVSLGWTRSEEK